jgi:hypothetical protein
MAKDRSRRRPAAASVSLLALVAAVLAAGVGGVGLARAPGALADASTCSSGVRTLSSFGDRVYPDQGNGGYRSVHTDLHIVYDTQTNLFLPGNHADLTIRATQCLTDFSFDFERTGIGTPAAGPNMTVQSVLVNGSPASFNFRQPTYPGNPNGPDDPNPQAHAISNVNPVSASNPLPPACSPQTSGNTQNGQQCPANKLVITPATPIAEGETITVTVNYTGRPGTHIDGDGSTEGWFRVNTTAAPNDGSFVTTEPVGSMAWMPLNNHPTAKPTYDIYDTVPVGKTAISAGELVGTTPPTGTAFAPVSPTSVNPPDPNFPGGSWTWHWHSPEPIANYLLTNSIGSYDLTARTSPTTGIQYFQAQASGLTAARKATIKAVLDTQEDITTFQTQFNGPWPFTTNGVIVALPNAGFEEEMQTKITFGNGASSTPSAGVFHHENMHQWFGDNVAEGGFNMTFWKEGWATVGEYLLTARNAANAAGGMGTPAGAAAFDNSLISRFNTNYGTTAAQAWTSAPSNPTVGNLFTTVSTYTRPGTTYLALRQILDSSASRPGSDRWIGVMKQIQSQYGGGSITKAQLQQVFHQWLPNQSAACHAKLDQFFTQWFDTAYPTPNNATNKPQITGPGLNGPDKFYDDASACTRADQAITFGALPNRAPGDPDFQVSATSDSGLPVAFSASGQCTVTGSTVHLLGLGVCAVTAAQAGDGVFKPAVSITQSFTIHAPVVGNDAPAGGAEVDYSDPLDPTVTVTATDAASPGSSLVAVASGLPAGLSLATDTTSPDATFPGTRTWKVVGAVTQAPGTYPVSVTVTNDAGTTGATSFALVVGPEDTEIGYEGDSIVFAPAGGTSGSVLLRATVREPEDGSPGDIRTATVSFVEGATVLCGPLAVVLLDGDPTSGTAACTRPLDLGTHEVTILVGGNYAGEDDTFVEVLEPSTRHVTAAGRIITGSSGGAYAATTGSRQQFDFDVKYREPSDNGKKKESLKGHIDIRFTSGGKSYRIRSDEPVSLGVDYADLDGAPCAGPTSPTCFGLGDLRASAKLIDVTKVKKKPKKVTVATGLTLRITVTDRAGKGSADSIGITLWNGTTLVFSSAWTGSETIERALEHGKVHVR